MALFNAYIYFVAGAAGACLGSFVNVVAYRYQRGISFVSGRSMCPGCGEVLCWDELIPVLSYFLQGGRCRHCGAKISRRYPVTEAVAAVAAVLCLSRFGVGLQTLLAVCVSMVLLAVALVDLDTMRIPDSFVAALAFLAVAALFVFRDVSIASRLIGFFAVSLPMLLLTAAIQGAFGGGDIKLIAVCGFLLGVKGVLAAFFVSLMTGGGYAVYLLAGGKGRRGGHIAFGPFLCVGVFAAMLWGRDMLELYLNMCM